MGWCTYSKGVLVAIPVKTRAQLLCVNACTFLVVQLLGKVRDTQDVNERMRKIKRVLNKILVGISFIIFPAPLDNTHVRGRVAAPIYRGYLVTCYRLQFAYLQRIACYCKHER